VGRLLYWLKASFLMSFLLFGALSFGQVPVIFDTEIGNDIDAGATRRVTPDNIFA
jgi:hypothetical protein